MSPRTLLPLNFRLSAAIATDFLYVRPRKRRIFHLRQLTTTTTVSSGSKHINMQFLWGLAVGFLAAIGPTVASPTPIGHARSDDGHFSIAQVHNPKFVRHGPFALYKALRKYGAPIPDELSASVQRMVSKRATGSAVATPELYDTEFLTPVSIGTPPQNLNVDIDTGSGDMWVFASSTPAWELNGHDYYSPANSSTSAKLTGQAWEISYGDGSSCSGDVYTDTVSLGGLTVTQQAVECAKELSPEFTNDTSNDGLIGLAFSMLNTVTPTQQKTFFESALESLDSPVFTADLKAGARKCCPLPMCRHLADLVGLMPAGLYNFGYIDNSSFMGAITYTRVDNSNGFWEFTSTGYSVGSGSFKSAKIDGIADTGTTLLLLPPPVVADYYKQVDGAKYSVRGAGWIFPCETKPPNFVFGVEGARITIPGKYVSFSPDDTLSTNCFGGIQENTGIEFAIFGDVALKSAFVVFDGGKKQLGWASKVLH